MAQLLTGTRVYGNTSIDSQLIVGNVTPYAATSNTTGSLIVTGGMGITGNLFMSAANNYSTTSEVNSYRLGWSDNYFTRSPIYNGMYFSGSFLAIKTGPFYIEGSSSFVARGVITNDTGNNTVIFNAVAPVRLQNTAASTSNTTGALIVGGGVGVSGNIWVGGTNAGVNGVYTDVLRYAANGLPWVMGSGGGAGGGTGTGNANTFGWLANTIIVANSTGYLSNSNSFYTSSNNTTIINGQMTARGNVTVNGNIIVANTLTSNTARIEFNAALGTLDFIIG